MKANHLRFPQPQNQILKVSYPPIKRKKLKNHSDYIRRSLSKLANKSIQIEEVFQEIQQESRKMRQNWRKGFEDQKFFNSSTTNTNKIKLPEIRNAVDEGFNQTKTKIHDTESKSTYKYIQEKKQVKKRFFLSSSPGQKIKIRVISEPKKPTYASKHEEVFAKNRQFMEKHKKNHLFGNNPWLNLSQKLEL